MKKITLTAFFLCICIFLSACTTLPADNNTLAQDDPIVSDDQTHETPNTDDEPPPDQDTTSDDENADAVVYPAELRGELVVEWEMADVVLSLLDELSDLLRTAVAEAGCQLDSVTLTLSTAGAYTADSLVDGGIDIAILPSVDIIRYEKRAAILALSDDEIPMTAIVASLADNTLSPAFRDILFTALTETEAGQEFLSAVCGEAVFSAPTEETLQAVRDYYQELMNEEGEHEQ